MINAMEAIKRGSSIKGAVEEDSFPRMTLQDQILEQVEHIAKSGQQPVIL